jgi:hypothetical protein
MAPDGRERENSTSGLRFLLQPKDEPATVYGAKRSKELFGGEALA